MMSHRPKKYIYLAFLLVTLFLLFSETVLALAECSTPNLEICYPDIGINISGNKIGEYASYIITFIIMSVGGIGVITIVYAGFKILLNFGKPETITQARAKIVDTIIGVALLMSSYLILTTINPELALPASGNIKYLPYGVYFEKTVAGDAGHPEGKDYKAALLNVSDINADPFLSSGKVRLHNKCKAGSTSQIRMWLFTDTDFRRASANSGDVQDNESKDASRTVDLPCNTSSEDLISAGYEFSSFFFRPKDTGIYFYSDAGCQDLAACNSNNQNCSQKNSGRIPFFDTLPAIDGAQTVRCVEIVNGDKGRDEQWGVVVSTLNDFTGTCSDPILALDEETKKVLQKGAEIKTTIEKVTSDEIDDEGNYPLVDLDPSYAYIFHPSPQDLPNGVVLRSPNLQKYIKPSKKEGDTDTDYIGAQYKYVAVCPEGSAGDDCREPAFDFNPGLNELFVEPDYTGLLRSSVIKEGVETYGNLSKEDVQKTKECRFGDIFTPCLENIYSKGSNYSIFLYARSNDYWFSGDTQDVETRCMVANGLVEKLKSNGAYSKFIGTIADIDTEGEYLSYKSQYDVFKIYLIPSSITDR